MKSRPFQLHVIVGIGLSAAALLLASCKPLAFPAQKEVTQTAASGEVTAAATPSAPAVATPAPTPTPPAVWYTLDRISVTMPDGVVGYPPGTMVRYIAEGLYFLDGHEIELSPLQVTPDLEVVSQVLAGKEAQKQMLERRRIEALRLQQLREQEQNSSSGTSGGNSGGGASHGSPVSSNIQSAAGSGWLHGGRTPASQPTMPVLPAEPVAPQPVASQQEATGPVSLPLRSQVGSLPAGETTPSPLQSANTASNAASASTPPGEEGLQTAVRQYQTGNTRYTVRVTGERVEE